MPENTVYVGRPSIFGNMHPGSRWDDDEWEFGPYPTWAECVVDCYRRWLTGDDRFIKWWRLTLWGALEQQTGDKTLQELKRRLPELRGKNLACWCPLDSPCHADVLLELANA